jgi:hypothetical protein
MEMIDTMTPTPASAPTTDDYLDSLYEDAMATKAAAAPMMLSEAELAELAKPEYQKRPIQGIYWREGWYAWDRIYATISHLKSELERARTVVNEQADDDGLWFVAETAAEAYLQSALRRLHEAMEGKSALNCAIAALSPRDPSVGEKNE